MAGKRRGNREGCINKRKDGRWEGRYTVPGGKRRCVYGRTRQEAAVKMADALRNLDFGIDSEAATRTVGEHLDQWLIDVEPTVRPNTIIGYAQHVRDHIKPVVGRVKLKRLGPAHVRQLIRELESKGLSAATIGRVHATLRNALSQAERDGLVPRNVAKLVKPPKVERKPPPAMTVRDALALLDAVRDDRIGPLVLVALTTGLRQGELLGLHWEDVDLEERSLTVNVALQRVRGKAVLAPPKSEASRRIAVLPNVAVAVLRKQRATQKRERLIAGSRWHDSGLVFTTTTGTPMDGSKVGKQFKALLSAAGLPPLNFHHLRHGCASLMSSFGLPIRGVADVLGHSDPALTLRTYTHIAQERRQEAADRLGHALTGR